MASQFDKSRPGQASNVSPQARRARSVEDPALVLLRDAWECARDGGVDPWQFAVEIEVLRLAGLTNTDLRWLVNRGLLEHRSEQTRPGDRTRRFRRSTPRSLALSQRDCFILAEAGYQLASKGRLREAAHVPAVEPPDSPHLSTPSSRPSPPSQGGATGGLAPAQQRDIGELDAASASPPSQGGASEGQPRATSTSTNSMRTVPLQSAPRLPSWDAKLHELRLGRELIKRFSRPARAQEAILSAFQEEGWPSAIDDPLPAQYNQDPKRRLHYTVRNLNRSQHPLRIRFFINGNGETIHWKIVPERCAKGNGRARQ
jgi:hypothetical protein